jgi:hypothetical protein
MSLRKIILASSTSAFILGGNAFGQQPVEEAYLNLKPTESDFKRGAYVDYVESFLPGEQVTGWHKKVNNVLGREKNGLENSLSLGHYGEVIVSYTQNMGREDSAVCFMSNGNSPSLYVHEANSPGNRPETVEVFVTPDKNLDERTKWISLGTKSVLEGKDNWIPFHMSIKKAYHVKLRDAGSKLTTSVPEYAGFDASAILLARPCTPIA